MPLSELGRYYPPQAVKAYHHITRSTWHYEVAENTDRQAKEAYQDYAKDTANFIKTSEAKTTYLLTLRSITIQNDGI